MQWIGSSKFVEPEFGISCAGLFVEHFPRASFLFTFPCTFFVGGKKKGGSVQLSQCTDPWLNVLGHLVELLKQIAANMKVRGGVLYRAAGLYIWESISSHLSCGPKDCVHWCFRSYLSGKVLFGIIRSLP